MRAAQISVVNNGKTSLLRRLIQHLEPLELSSTSQKNERVVEEDQVNPDEANDVVIYGIAKPRRKAAVQCDVLRRDILKRC